MVVFYSLNFVYGIGSATAISMVTCQEGVTRPDGSPILYLRNRPGLEYIVHQMVR